MSDINLPINFVMLSFDLPVLSCQYPANSRWHQHHVPLQANHNQLQQDVLQSTGNITEHLSCKIKAIAEVWVLLFYMK